MIFGGWGFAAALVIGSADSGSLQVQIQSLSEALSSRRTLAEFCAESSMPGSPSSSSGWVKTICPLQENIFPSSQNEPRPRTAFRWAQINEIQSEPIGRVVSWVSRQKLSELRSRIPKILATRSCPRNLSLGAARVLEKDSLEPEVKNEIRQLLGHADACLRPSHENYTAARLRMALLELLWQREEKAWEILQNTELVSDQADYSRLLFWRGFFERKYRKSTQTWQKLIIERPSTFHALLVNHQLGRGAKGLLSNSRFEPLKEGSDRENRAAFHFWVKELLKAGFTGPAERLAMGAWRAGLLDRSPEIAALLLHYFDQFNFTGAKVRLAGQLALTNPKFFTSDLVRSMFPKSFSQEIQVVQKRMDPHIAMAVTRQESAFDSRAVSPAGAVGLMQIMPHTARRFAGARRAELLVPSRNVEIGSRYLLDLVERFRDLEPALAAYNAGRARVDQWVRIYGGEIPDLLFVDLIPFRETRDYVSSILRNYFWYNHLYGNQEKPQQLINSQTSYLYRSFSNPVHDRSSEGLDAKAETPSKN